MKSKSQGRDTADVEKIARDLARDFMMGGWTVQDVIMEGIARARAPLVEALRQIEGQPCSCTCPLIAHAALTGTGEKEDLAGRTGNNNKEKGE